MPPCLLGLVAFCLTTITTSSSSIEKNTFQIVGKRDVLLVLTARNQQEKENWMRELNNVLSNDSTQQSGGTFAFLHRRPRSWLALLTVSRGGVCLNTVMIRLKRGCTTDTDPRMFINSPTVT